MSIDSLIRFDSRGSVTLLVANVEIGQGILTAVAQIAAEELDINFDRIRIQRADTGRTPTASYTAGSNSIQTVGSAFRQAAADARHLLLQKAAVHLQTPAATLHVVDGTISISTKNDSTGNNSADNYSADNYSADNNNSGSTTYWTLQGDRLFGDTQAGVGRPKNPAAYTLVGRAVERLDLPAKIFGQPAYIHDLSWPDMVYGRIVRPPHYGATLETVDPSIASSLPGVLAIIRDGSFLGVVATAEGQAENAAAALRENAAWEENSLPDPQHLYPDLLGQDSEDFLVVDGVPQDGPVAPVDTPADAAQTLNATYYRPYHMHAALGPAAAAARWQEGQLEVYSHTQGVYPLRGALASALDLDETQVRVTHLEGPGCYGHNGADDVALDAALLARAVPGRPVLVRWSRADEHAWEPYGSAMVVKMQASLDTQGGVKAWNHDVWSYSHSGRPRSLQGASNLLAAGHLKKPLQPPLPRPGKGAHGGIHRNADPLYSFARRRVVKHFVPNSPLRVSALRGLGAFANVFAIESFMDELAQAANIDPVEFRLRHLHDPRARAVIEAAAVLANWQSGPSWENNKREKGRGQGIGFAQYKNAKCYVAVIFDLSVDTVSGHIRLNRVAIAADAGQIVNPNGLENQLEGGVLQAASWALKEQVRYGTQGITSLDWDTYPVLRFDEVPEVAVKLIDRPGLPSLGSGEATQGPTPAAIANAVFAASGARLRQMPFTPKRLQETLARV
jgi:nicotinate dehydrogenase subunit B